MARGRDSDASEKPSGIYVYGIVPADVEVESDAEGIGDPPAKVDVVRKGDIAALVSPITTDQPLGKPECLQAHARLLDGTAAVAPVLPMRFGAVMTDEESVADELLGQNHDEFAEALRALEGHAEYIVKGRYEEAAILREVISESEEAQQLRNKMAGLSEDASRQLRMALGEIVVSVMEAKRRADTDTAIKALDEIAKQVNVREPTHELDAVSVAVLAAVDDEGRLQDAVDGLAQKWAARVQLRLLGPLAAYDFVVTRATAG
ncbi:GvpL/GvpF family gas vesicle protein [Mycobacterium sp. 1164985.4]|uniref:GvpL/GvpF family gas vesicle protein n=1 Tax=Mycobacterium sp. 1164985.4 TaxID=1834069 RepID=UPI0008017B14|nr:GvpL/GvpF family gas vesicle protein [Mycobacterium sp. 1164985.4]OBK76110.1 gas vesicle protein GvpFL [Mycobacterium sp. 1164985.4]